MEDRAELVAASLAAMQDQADPTAAATAITLDAAVPTAVTVDPERGVACRTFLTIELTSRPKLCYPIVGPGLTLLLLIFFPIINVLLGCRA
jgi:hypothetical protein